MSRATIEDVAKKAGVSIATVDRVLNGRAAVRPRNAERVEAAVRALNYHPDRMAARLARGRDYRFCFVLPEGGNAFMQGLAAEVTTHAAHLVAERVSADVVLADVFDPDAMSAALSRLAAYDGVALVATDHPQVREAINALVSAGTEVVTLVSDVPGSMRAHYVGIDNASAGRTAATLMGRFLQGRSGKVAVIAGALSLRDHAERHFGFAQVMRQEHGQLVVLPVSEGRDDPARNRELIRALLRERTDITGIYNMGAGAEGIAEALIQHTGSREIVFITHELNHATRKGLLDGTIAAVISQDPGHEVRSAMRVLMARCDRVPVIAAMERISIDIFVRDNLP